MIDVIEKKNMNIFLANKRKGYRTMQIYGNKITFELADNELHIIKCLLSERVADMGGRLGSIDDSKYLQILQLKAKIEGINKIYEYETKNKTSRSLKDLFQESNGM